MCYEEFDKSKKIGISGPFEDGMGFDFLSENPPWLKELKKTAEPPYSIKLVLEYKAQIPVPGN